MSFWQALLVAKLVLPLYGRRVYVCRWRVYAFGQGDTLKAWRLEPFYIYSGGRRWAPPPEKYFQQP